MLIDPSEAYRVVLFFCIVMDIPPVCCPLPRIPHHVIQTKAIGRKWHHLPKTQNNILYTELKIQSALKMKKKYSYGGVKQSTIGSIFNFLLLYHQHIWN